MHSVRRHRHEYSITCHGGYRIDFSYTNEKHTPGATAYKVERVYKIFFIPVYTKTLRTVTACETCGAGLAMNRPRYDHGRPVVCRCKLFMPAAAKSKTSFRLSTRADRLNQERFHCSLSSRPLTRACELCGNSVKGDWRFCPHCGAENTMDVPRAA